MDLIFYKYVDSVMKELDKKLEEITAKTDTDETICKVIAL